MLARSYSRLPKESGVYLFKDKRNRIIYIGKAKNLKSRVSSYFGQADKLGLKTRILVSQINTISYIPVQSEIEALLLEANLIQKHQPKYNLLQKDNKSYPYLKITRSEKYSRVFLTRKFLSDKAYYYGPYPDAGSLKFLLRNLRGIFPYCTCKKTRPSCLYRHLELCPPLDTKTDLKNYRKNIYRIKLFLEGKSIKVLNYLKTEMALKGEKLEFEAAGQIKNRISKIQNLIQTKIDPALYENNPHLLSDLRNQEIKELQKVLNLSFVPHKIECYDISNLTGKEATGSLVVSVNGNLSKKDYRRFKIKSKSTPDDYWMLREVLTRRLTHPEWTFPDLIVIDGGIGHVSSAQKILREKNVHIPVIGLAKKNEEIICSDGLKIVLEKNSPALLHLIRLRDEAHRFAKSYHLHLRSKKMVN